MTIEAKLDKTNELLGEVIRVLQLPRGLTPGEQTVIAAPAEAPKTRKAKPTEPTPAPVPAPAPAPTVESFDDFDTPAAAPKLVVDDARKALVALQKAKESPEASRGILKANGLTSLAGLKDEDQEKIAKIVRECSEAIAAHKKA